MEVQGKIILAQQILRINGNLHLTDCPIPCRRTLVNALEEIGSTMCAYCEVGGVIEGDTYMAFDKLRDYPNTKIEVTGSVTMY